MKSTRPSMYWQTCAKSATLHPHWTLLEQERGETYLLLILPILCFINCGGRLLNFYVSALLSDRLEVPRHGCHPICRLSSLRPDLRQVDMLFVISFQSTMGFFCFEL